MSKGILTDKIIITGEIELLSGMHIGGSKDFAPIGAIDNMVVRDALSQSPYIPGSSLKGKMRSLLARAEAYKEQNDVQNAGMESSREIKRLFGTAAKEGESFLSRLQFCDIQMSDDSIDEIRARKTELYLTEIKMENTIDRESGRAKHPRSMERVPKGARFNLELIYNLENIEEAKDDLEYIYKAFKLLSWDYLGGSGSRGYGRVRFNNLTAENLDIVELNDEDKVKINKIVNEFDKKLAEHFAVNGK